MSTGSLIASVAACRELEARVQRAGDIDEIELMRRAANAALVELQRRWPSARRIAIVCGSGNNGGDGLVMAAIAKTAGFEVGLYAAELPLRCNATTQLAHQQAIDSGLEVEPLAPAGLAADVIVDGLLGIGLNRPPSEAFARAITMINQADCPVMALDMPSGVSADNAEVASVAVKADLTLTFLALKPGLLTGAGRELCGELVLAELGASAEQLADLAPPARLLRYADLRQQFKPRNRNAHKGDFGHVLVIGGAPGYAGAARLAAEAAARSGAGLVSIATAPEHAHTIAASRPELMCHGINHASQLRRLIDRATVIAIGPGLGQSAWARAMFAVVDDARLPLVVDADGLNLLAQEPNFRDDRIITPHPGEAGRLLGMATAEVQRDRYAAVRKLSQRYGGVAVLKGAGSLVDDGTKPPAVIDDGNPGMASGGMGDVLTGVIAALLAQQWEPIEAAELAVAAHAWAADRAAADSGERGLLAGDLAPYLRLAVNNYEC